MYFFVNVLFDMDGIESGKGTTAYPTMDTAEQAFHTAISSAISKTGVSKIIAMIFDQYGTVQMKRVWQRGLQDSVMTE